MGCVAGQTSVCKVSILAAALLWQKGTCFHTPVIAAVLRALLLALLPALCTLAISSCAPVPKLHSLVTVGTPAYFSAQQHTCTQPSNGQPILISAKRQWYSAGGVGEGGREGLQVIGTLKGHDDKVRVVLNKADQVDMQQLMRVYGALMWSLGKVFKTPEVRLPRVVSWQGLQDPRGRLPLSPISFAPPPFRLPLSCSSPHLTSLRASSSSPSSSLCRRPAHLIINLSSPGFLVIPHPFLSFPSGTSSGFSLFSRVSSCFALLILCFLRFPPPQ